MQKLCGRIIRIWSPFVVWMSCRRVVPPTDPKLAVQCSVDLLVDFTLLNNDFFQCIALWVYFPIWCRTTNYPLYPLYHPQLRETRLHPFSVQCVGYRSVLTIFLRCWWMHTLHVHYWAEHSALCKPNLSAAFLLEWYLYWCDCNCIG